MLEQELAWGLEIVAAASVISRAVQGEDFTRWDKGDKTPVTVADLAVQAIVSAGLSERFPHDQLMAEEGSSELRQVEWAMLLDHVTQHAHTARPDASRELVLDWIEHGQTQIDPERRYWVLDPVDGTKGFLRRGQYAIALALIENGQVQLGVLGCPNLPPSLGGEQPLGAGQIYAATKGGGAFVVPCETGADAAERRRLQVSADGNAAQANWCERVESSDRNKDRTTDIVRAAGIGTEPQRLDSQAKYAVVARGEASLYLRHTLDPDYRECVWDHAAGALIVEEAGGRVTDLRGNPLDVTQGRRLTANRGIVATNGLLHDQVLAAVKQVLGEI